MLQLEKSDLHLKYVDDCKICLLAVSKALDFHIIFPRWRKISVSTLVILKLTSNPRHQLDLFPLQLRLETGESYVSFPGILRNQKEKKAVS